VLAFRQAGPDGEVLVSTLTEAQYHALRENSLFGMIRSILSELKVALTTLRILDPHIFFPFFKSSRGAFG
jgi:hypothetical protein